MMKAARFNRSWIDGAGALIGWTRLAVPTGDHVVICRSVGTERAKTWRGGNSGAFFGPLGGSKHELVARDFLR
jgi:hypothetical protein